MTKSHIQIMSEELDYATQQITAYAKAKNISSDGNADIIYYDMRQNPDKIGIDDLAFSISYNYYAEHSDVTFDEIDEQILSIYRDYKKEEDWYVNRRENPFIMIIDGITKEKSSDEFHDYLINMQGLVEFLNIYILVIL